MHSGYDWARIVLLAGLMGALPALAQGNLISDLESQLAGIPGRVSVDSRLRYEVFDQDGGLDVDGISHRIRYGYTTPESGGLSAMIEGETLYTFGHGTDLHPADNAGDGTELNQLWAAYRNDEWGSAKLGRQIYTLDDHRFIGHVGWRQNIQTFDALTAELRPTGTVALRGFLIDAVNTVTALRRDIECYGLNGSWQLTPAHTLTAFYYSLNGGQDLAAGSNNTAGLRFTGSAESDDVKWKYAFSYSRQWENSDYPGAAFGHDYYAADVSASLGGGSMGVGYERLGGNGSHGFTTPLATLHKFNGFADVFLGASASGGLVNGLEDTYIYGAYSIPVANGIRIQAIYHVFSPVRGEGDYGKEIDLVAGYAFSKTLSLLAKYANYQSDHGFGGIGTKDKRMFSLELNFIF